MLKGCRKCRGRSRDKIYHGTRLDELSVPSFGSRYPPRIGRRERKFYSPGRMERAWKWNCQVRSVNGYALLKGITSGGKEEVASSKDGRWMDLHGNCERRRHGVVGCARIVKETPNGAENTDSASSFPFSFFFPLFLPTVFPTIFRRIRSNRTLQVMSRGLLNTPRLRSVRPFLSFSSRKSWNVERNGVARELVAFTTWIYTRVQHLEKMFSRTLT